MLLRNCSFAFIGGFDSSRSARSSSSRRPSRCISGMPFSIARIAYNGVGACWPMFAPLFIKLFEADGVIETAGPIARQKTFPCTPGDEVEACLVVEKSLLRNFGTTRGKAAVGQSGRTLRNVFAGDRRCCIQRNCSASVEPSNAVVELLPPAIICATRSK